MRPKPLLCDRLCPSGAFLFAWVLRYCYGKEKFVYVVYKSQVDVQPRGKASSVPYPRAPDPALVSMSDRRRLLVAVMCYSYAACCPPVDAMRTRCPRDE